MRPSSQLKQGLAFCLAILPAGFLAILIWRYSVDFPQWDEWWYVQFFEKFAQGSLTFADLFAQVNEYRQFFPNLIFVGLGWLTRDDVRYEMWISFLLACLVSFNVYRLARMTVEGSARRRLLLLFVCNLLIFSPSQYENWLQGQQLVYYVPIACVTTGMVVAYSRLRTSVKFLICACLSTISTFSSANGIICWIVVLPVLMLLDQSPRSSYRRWLVTIWIVALLAGLALYLHGYHKPWWSPSPAAAFVHPTQGFLYFLGFVGAPLGMRRLTISSVAAIILTISFVFSCAFLFKRRADLMLLRRTIGWLMIGTYSVLTAVMTTIGRSGFGVGQSQITSRYIAFSCYLIVSLIFLALIITRRIREDSGARPTTIRQIVFVLVGALILWQPVVFTFFTLKVIDFKPRLLQAKAKVLFINFAQDGTLRTTLYPDVNYLAQKANALNRLGFLRPALINTNRIQELADPDPSETSAFGSFDSLTRLDDNSYVVSGQATLPNRGEPADAVLLAYETASGDSILFALAYPDRNEITTPNGTQCYARCWRRSFSVTDLPLRPAKLTAWAFDANSGRAFQLVGSQEIP